MKTLKKVEVEFKKFDFLLPKYLEDNIIYISEEYETATHKCLCGCGLPSVTPLDKNGWTIDTLNGKLTMKPSILNRTCKAHYIITNGVANFV